MLLLSYFFLGAFFGFLKDWPNILWRNFLLKKIASKWYIHLFSHRESAFFLLRTDLPLVKSSCATNDLTTYLWHILVTYFYKVPSEVCELPHVEYSQSRPPACLNTNKTFDFFIGKTFYLALFLTLLEVYFATIYCFVTPELSFLMLILGRVRLIKG